MQGGLSDDGEYLTQQQQELASSQLRPEHDNQWKIINVCVNHCFSVED